MVEIRKDVPFPYKGYIFCQSEDEANECLEIFRDAAQELKLFDIKCAISHGCSEFGQKYPDFKYSPDGKHRSFQRLGNWDKLEAEHFLDHYRPLMYRLNASNEFVTIRDVFGFYTWVVYAEILGDMSYKTFVEAPITNRPEPFASRVRSQSKMRNGELDELRQMLEPQN